MSDRLTRGHQHREHAARIHVQFIDLPLLSWHFSPSIIPLFSFVVIFHRPRSAATAVTSRHIRGDLPGESWHRDGRHLGNEAPLSLRCTICLRDRDGHSGNELIGGLCWLSVPSCIGLTGLYHDLGSAESPVEFLDSVPSWPMQKCLEWSVRGSRAFCVVLLPLHLLVCPQPPHLALIVLTPSRRPPIVEASLRR
jgi:hypothetical protein